MPQERLTRRALCLSLSALVFVPALSLLGCNEEQNTETVIPEISPAEKARESMDYYRNKNPKKGDSKK